MPTRDPADPLAGDKEAAQRRLLRLLKERMGGHLDELMAVLGDPPDLGKLTPAFWETEAGKMAAVLRPEIERMALAGANAMANTVAVLWDEAVIAREAADWALSYVGQLISGIDSHTLDLVRRQVRAFIDTPGMTIGDLRNSLLPAFGERRAQMIAVTETTAAYQAGQRVIQQELERGGLRRLRKWNTAGDEKVCDLCGPLDQTTEDTWTDTQGPPRHPNCILPGNAVVAPGGVSAAAQSFYIGRAIEIALADGRTLTVTANHPILTRGGWVAARLLKEGDDVFCATDVERILAAIDPDDEQVPAAIEDVFAALKESPSMLTVSVPVSAEDLHGDGHAIHGDIDIVRPNGQLLGDGVTASGQGVGQDGLDGAGVSKGALSAEGVSVELGGRSLAASRSLVGGDEHGGAVFRGGALPAQEHAVGDVARVDTGLEDTLPEGPAIDSSLAREFLLRFAGDVTAQQIVQVRDFEFSGHVFDLQCDMYGLYITSGVLVKNCRCWTTFVRPT